jgi:hypothetical protein
MVILNTIGTQISSTLRPEATASLMSEMEALTAENKRLLEGLDKTGNSD